MERINTYVHRGTGTGTEQRDAAALVGGDTEVKVRWNLGIQQCRRRRVVCAYDQTEDVGGGDNGMEEMAISIDGSSQRHTTTVVQ